ncbi:MAG TPA: anthranilate synthase component I family protein, partial [Chitinophagaceae bacterium]
MKKIRIETTCKKLLADVFTPVGIYLRLRDRFRDTVLLESTDHHVAENSYSFICINAIGGIEISSAKSIEFKLPGQKPEKMDINKPSDVPQLLSDFMQRFDAVEGVVKEAKYAQGLFGYTSYDAVQFFENLSL